MTLTRTPACTVKGCPAPRDPDWHVPICGHGMAGEHQHWPKRSQGGKTIVAFLCHDCHTQIDSGPWGNDVKDMPGRGLVYFAWDIHGNTLIEREVLSDGADGGAGEAVQGGHQKKNPAGGVSVAPSSAPSPSAGLGGEAATPPQVSPSPSLTKEESDGQISGNARRPAVPVASDSSGPGGDSPSPLTHEQRVAIAQDIKNTEWNRQWFAGDIGNLWIEQLGESAEQYLSDFGYQPESLANILRVCAAIKPAFRYENLRFSHHVVVYDQPPEVRMDWLAECEVNGWSVAEFRRQVKGTKPRVKRYSVEELREAALRFSHGESVAEFSLENPGHAERFMEFFDYLEEQA